MRFVDFISRFVLIRIQQRTRLRRLTSSWTTRTCVSIAVWSLQITSNWSHTWLFTKMNRWRQLNAVTAARLTIMKLKLALEYQHICIKSAGWVSDWLSDWVCNFSPWASAVMEAAKKRNLAQRWPRGWGLCSIFEYTRNAEKACDTTVDDEICDTFCSAGGLHNEASVTTSHITCLACIPVSKAVKFLVCPIQTTFGHCELVHSAVHFQNDLLYV